MMEAATMAKAKKRARFSPELGAKAFDLYKQYGSYSAVGKQIGCDGVTAKAWIEKHKAALKQKQQTAKKNGQAKSLATIAQLQDENAFLRWWNDGERNGYVERLLARLNETTN